MNSGVNTSGSIRRRLTLQLVGSAAILTTALFFIVQGFARDLAEQSQDNILVASAQSILESTAVHDGGITADIPYSALAMLGNVSDDRVFYRITAGDEVLTGYSDLPVPGGPFDAEGRQFQTGVFDGDSIRMVSAIRRLSVSGLPVDVTVSVAQTRNGQALTLARISRTAVLLGLGFFAFAAILGVLAAQSTVRPLQVLAGSVSRRGPKDMRPVSAPVPSEMAPLVEALNTFMARLKVTLVRTEDFIAEAAHRVRTPLATVRTQAETALRRVERPENRQSIKEMIRAIDESSRAAGQLLDHAMITFRTDQMEQSEFELDALVIETVERLQPVADLKDILLDVETEHCLISGDAILIQNAVRNVLDNAIKYAPRDTIITVSLACGTETEISVRDQGQGFPETDTERLTGRFVRGDNVSGTVGSGLGLTIANEVMTAHGGRLVILNHERGGACVSLVFPSS